MEHLNYCRQLTKQLLGEIESSGTVTHEQQLAMLAAKVSTKFLLPDGGRLVDDPEFKALDETQPLRMPYQVIALEYYRGGSDPEPGLNKSSKAIVFAHEYEENIALTQVSWGDALKRWVIAGTVLIPKTGYIDRTVMINGRVGVKYSHPKPPATHKDFADEVGAFLSFLNILQCSNVHAERSEPKRGNKKTKAALSFDSYHILTIDIPKTGESNGAPTGTHRSPREHLRRGHIRRLADGRRIWVNAAIVGAGKGAGVVSKDYMLRHAA
jgi:hypothetical protein